MTIDEYVIERLKKLEAENDELSRTLKKAESELEDSKYRLNEITAELRDVLKGYTDYDTFEVGCYRRIRPISGFDNQNHFLVYRILKGRVDEIEGEMRAEKEEKSDED